MYELPFPPKPGEILLYVELTQIENMSIGECLAMLQEMGYCPELRYRQWQSTDNQTLFGLFALLKHEDFDPDDVTYSSDCLIDEWEAIAVKIKPSIAVHCPHGRRRAIAA